MSERLTHIVHYKFVRMNKEQRADFIVTRQKGMIDAFNENSKLFGMGKIKTNEEFVENFNALTKKHKLDLKNCLTPPQKVLRSMYLDMVLTHNLLQKNKAYLEQKSENKNRKPN